jgi:hypothetical protein
MITYNDFSLGRDGSLCILSDNNNGNSNNNGNNNNDNNTNKYCFTRTVPIFHIRWNNINTNSNNEIDKNGDINNNNNNDNDNNSNSNTIDITFEDKTFVTSINAADSGFVTGSVVSARALASPGGAYGFGGIINSFIGNTLTITTTGLTGSGIYSDWEFSIAGVRGFTGSRGPSSIVPSSQSGALAFYYNSGTTIVGDPGLTIANNALRIGSTSSNIVDLLVMRESIPNLNNDLNNGIKLRQQFDSSLSAAISVIKSRGSRSNPTVLQKMT